MGVTASLPERVGLGPWAMAPSVPFGAATWLSWLPSSILEVVVVGGGEDGMLAPFSWLFPPSVESQGWRMGWEQPCPSPCPKERLGWPWRRGQKPCTTFLCQGGERWQPQPLASPGSAAPDGCVIPWSCDHRGLAPPQSSKFPDLSVCLALRGPCLPLGPQPQLN